ncbi:MAG TPA: hypothetical protein VJA44_06505 [Acidimicrobiia bacterium]|nr:hypothetical protein [Acidimicrobiia bacterium]
MTRAITAALFLIIAACGDDSSAITGSSAVTTTTRITTPTLPYRPLRGFSLSPQNYEADGFTGFFETASPQADVIERVADVVEWEEAPGSGTTVVEGLAAQYGYLPISIAGVFDVDDGELLRPIDGATFDRYIAAARGYAERHHPRFLGLGVEIDTQWRTHPDDFDRFVELFAAVADAVHEASPETQLLTVFQLERLSGMQGGLFGGDNDESLAAWQLIDRFPGADVIGFTTYPGLVFPTPDDIPDDYYSRLGEAAGGRPIAFTEMGWHASGDFGEYAGTPEKQARFVERFSDLIASVDVAFFVWSFLYDQAIPEPFASMGLIAADGTLRPAWDVWIEADG